MALAMATPSKFQQALNSPRRGLLTPKTAKKNRLDIALHENSPRTIAAKKPTSRISSLYREYASEISGIRSVEELHIDHSRALAIKRGDLAIIQGEVFRCTPRAPHLKGVPLIIKRMECVDRKTYDLKLFEADMFARFQGHSNIISLFSYWNEKPLSNYAYKNITLLFEEGIFGDMKTIVVQRQGNLDGSNDKASISDRLALRYASDLAKGLHAIHSCDIIHAKIKPSAIFLDENGTVKIGELGKVELDSARETHQLFSKLLLGKAIPETLVYWAPELLKLQTYGKPIDMWAFGVSLYEIVTGRFPFVTEDENLFRDEALTASYDISLIRDSKAFPIIDGCIRVDPEKRWTASQVLQYVQTIFAVDIQRYFRGYRERRKYKRLLSHVITIQANVKGWLQAKRYKIYRVDMRNFMATRIQSCWKSSVLRRRFNRIRECFCHCQANIKTKQLSSRYRRFRQDVLKCQSIVRRCIATRWLAKVKAKARDIAERCQDIQGLLVETQDDINDLRICLNVDKLPAALSYLESFETYELKRPLAGTSKALPRLHEAEDKLKFMEEENQRLRDELKAFQEEKIKTIKEEEELQAKLGPKYLELEPIVAEVKRRMVRLAALCREATPLSLTLQHPFPYSRWDAVHEPDNVVENILEDDDRLFRQLSPTIDLTLAGGKACFLSEVFVCPGDVGPASVEIFVSSVVDSWAPLITYDCTREQYQVFRIPGEQICKYVRLKFSTNIRGGSIVSLRYIGAKGLVKEERKDLRSPQRSISSLSFTARPRPLSASSVGRPTVEQDVETALLGQV